MKIESIKHDNASAFVQETNSVEKVLIHTSKGIFEVSETPDGEVRLTAVSALGSRLVIRPRASNLVLLDQE